MNDVRFYTVPAGHHASRCSGATCRAAIYWIRENGRPIPVDCSVAGGVVPSETSDVGQIDVFSTDAPIIRDGKGQHHMGLCPDAAQFRNPAMSGH